MGAKRTWGFFMREHVLVMASGTRAVKAAVAMVNEGLADEESGDVNEGYGGHLAKIGRLLVHTNSDGGVQLFRASTVISAQRAMEAHRAYHQLGIVPVPPTGERES